MANETGVLIVGEIHEGAVSGTTAEMLGLARRLVEGGLGGKVSVALLGSGVAGQADGLGPAGADTVYVADDTSLAPFQNDAWLPVVEAIVKQANPALVLLAQSSIGRDLAPRLAFRLDTGVSMDTVDVKVEGGVPHLTRACYGGNARAVLSPVKLPAVANIKAKSQEPLEPQAGRS